MHKWICQKKHLRDLSLLVMSLICLSCVQPTASGPALSSVELRNGAESLSVDLSSCKATIDCRWSSVSVVPTAADPSCSITIDDLNVSSGSGSSSIATAVGKTVIAVRVSNKGGASTTYSITVKRPDPSFPPGVTLIAAAYETGADNLVGGTDDFIDGWVERRFDDEGRWLLDVAYRKGADYTLRTDDDAIETLYYDDKYECSYSADGSPTVQWSTGTYTIPVPTEKSVTTALDSAGRPVRIEYYYSAGNDGVWNTSDDPICQTTTYSYAGALRRAVSEYYGSDLTKGTSDDSTYYYEYSYNDHGYTATTRTLTVGADGLPFTGDDVTTLLIQYTYEYDARGNITHLAKTRTPTSANSSFLVDRVSTYDAQERLVDMLELYGDGHYEHRTYSYSASGDLECEARYMDSTSPTEPIVIYYFRFRRLGADEGELTAALPEAYTTAP